MKTALVKLALAAAVVPLGLFWADDEKKGNDNTEERRVEVKVLRSDGKEGRNPEVRFFVDEGDEQPAGKVTYLGVAIAPVPPVLAAHLPEVLSRDQGVLVTEVVPDSPAANAGLKEYDILLSYDDQRLLSAEQLIKLVRGDKPGRELTLGVLRAGKPEKVRVAVGEREMKTPLLEMPGRIVGDPFGSRREALRFFKELEEREAPDAKAGIQSRSNFSSLRLESLDGDRFKAEIEFKNEKGDTLKRSFEGTRDEIRKEIESDQELPEAIRRQLLRSIDFGGRGARPGAFRFSMPRGLFGDTWAEGEWDGFPIFTWPGSRDADQLFEQFSDNIDPETREKLKGGLRSIEEPKKKAVGSGRSL